MNETFLEKEIEAVKGDLLEMGGLVETALDEAFEALKIGDEESAGRVIENDRIIDELENSIDESCIRMLATQQPVARDLRFITVVMNIVGQLERAADNCVNLADRTLALIDLKPYTIPEAILEMFTVARGMIGDCLDAFVRRDVAIAFEVMNRDDRIDDLNRSLLEDMVQVMIEEKRVIRRGVELITAGRHLERIGDQATNISEQVVFLVEGTIIRHKPLD